MKYKDEGVPLVVIAGAEYGTGSSRDWAAKGTMLLGVRAVIAKSFERIHRSNLVGMGVLPLQFIDGEDAADARAHRQRDVRHRRHRARTSRPGEKLEVRASRDGREEAFTVRLRIDTPNEVDYYRHGGILPFVLRQLIAG